MSDVEKTIGDFRLGLDSIEQHNDFISSIYRELEPLKEWGELPAGTTYSTIADVILDTISGYGSIAEIPAMQLGNLIQYALEQIKDSEDE